MFVLSGFYELSDLSLYLNFSLLFICFSISFVLFPFLHLVYIFLDYLSTVTFVTLFLSSFFFFILFYHFFCLFSFLFSLHFPFSFFFYILIKTHLHSFLSRSHFCSFHQLLVFSLHKYIPHSIFYIFVFLVFLFT